MILTIEVDGVEGFYRALDQVELEVSDWRPAWEECDRLFTQIELQQFCLKRRLIHLREHRKEMAEVAVLLLPA